MKVGWRVSKRRVSFDRINEALTAFKKKPKDGERLYEVIYLTYISSENFTHNDYSIGLICRLGIIIG